MALPLNGSRGTCQTEPIFSRTTDLKVLPYNMEFHKTQYWGHFCLLSISIPLVTSIDMMESSLAYILMTPSFICPLVQILTSHKILLLPDFRTCMPRKCLKLNSNRTELLLIGIPAALLKSDISTITVSEDIIPVADQVKSFGEILDTTTLSFSTHVSSVCQTACSS